MLGLKLLTDPRWANIAEGNLEEILTDHAWCEQKAASNAISLIMYNSEHEELVHELTAIAIEEMQHFQMVIDIIKARGYTLGKERKDDYVGQLMKFNKKDGSRNMAFIDRLLFAAMIEARSCERFRVLSQNIKDEELAKFYHDLMVSEANHYTTFLNFARQFSTDVDVDKRWKEWLDFEGKLIQSYGTKEAIHG
ncbi:tRNA 2-methylthio-N6-isopentenyl adenosine(37) hydroxylase MiaE [Sphingobacterium faecium NBRC 15299]|jgi:tRNA-(ms[2]io[6]A)-hydroxylase|uniref:tRNA-(ms[2]io[6]A)-hydroxylase n=1 Tax=Sphingobacterium faecium TaxID=34087 RepID=UPI000D3AC5B6|nr:tRNA-(ms[2]io[6]A)-hydroxylase [Sphingobacterium faecium]MQP26036.1 tRNA 2-methylthio-N6-isopentenyl adenosine(37) hydroxylase MiaE [Sphingobacterium faecium]PTX11009.1 tRNA-(ms[2]io[6]A)-hydroxylase [Sphingobacterium faecium]UZJ65046.1 tRNA-(ms[2]io[6]A)-hydroxylase [Sphingobacterium sp. KU25419]GEM62880.1 tRNA 2-methylthio-N6-isopentenyl adenosine(37) hydroxylase MiaE [Sphingobacterium faecium NBRC 15299]